MFNKEATPARSYAWLAVSMCAPLVQVAGGSNWTTVLVTGVICFVLAVAVFAFGVEISAKWLLWSQLIWLSVVASEIATWTTAYWPQYRSFPVVPLALILVAFFAAVGGIDRASRAGAVLFWFLLLLYGAVLLAGMKEVELKWLAPGDVNLKPRLTLVLLLPLLMMFHEKESRGVWKPLAAILVFGLLVSAITTGVLSPGIAEGSSSAFYEASRSLSLFGIVERFESVVAAALTLGYFCTLAYIFSTAAQLAGEIKPGWEKRGAAMCAAAGSGLLLAGSSIPPELLLIGCAVMWVLLPVLSTAIGRKIQKKTRKSP